MKTTTYLLLMLLLALPASVFASGGHGHTSHSETKKEATHTDDHPGMSVEGTMYMLGVHEVDGVKGAAHINDVREQMEKHGLQQTHHLMLGFEDVASGEAIETGSVAVKVEDPDGTVHGAVKMMGMDGHFGVDLTFDKKGMYHFKIGTKLPDGKKRVFHHHFDYK